MNDYKQISAAMRKAARMCETESQRQGVQRAYLCLAEVLAADNPAFDRAGFVADCKVAKTETAFSVALSIAYPHRDDDLNLPHTY